MANLVKKSDSEGPPLTGRVFASTILNNYINDVAYKDHDPTPAEKADIRETRYALRIGYDGATQELGDARAEEILRLFMQRHQKDKSYS